LFPLLFSSFALHGSEYNGIKKGVPTDEGGENKMPTGKVVGIFQQNWRDYVATLQESNQVDLARLFHLNLWILHVHSFPVLGPCFSSSNGFQDP